MPSLQSKIFFGLLKLINIKSFISKLVANRKRKNKPFFSNWEIKKHNILSKEIDQREIWNMGVNLEAHTHIIYFHGGMYAIEGIGLHKRWLLNLFQRADCKITYVDYPLAPEYTVDQSIKMVVNTYRFLTERFPDDHFILMGDSAGGGLALVLAQYLRDQNVEKQPEKLILYSPWVRLDMQNPQIWEIAQRDVLLDLGLLRKSAQLYAGELDLTNKYLSPYYHSCQGLGALYVFYGSEEILAPDIILLERKCKTEGDNATFHCYDGMQHIFHLFTFLPESKNVFTRTLDILTNR